MTNTDLTPRQRRRKKRLHHIKTEAMNMVIDRGVEDFSVNKLASRVDLTPGALYRYFDSRDAILAAVEIEVLQHFEAYFEALEDHCREYSGLRKVVVLSLGYVALADLQPQRFRLISEFVARPEPILDDNLAGDVVGPTLRSVGRFVTALDAAALDEGDALHRAALTWSSLQGFVNHRKLTRLPEVPLDPEELLIELLRTLLTGWGADREQLEQALEAPPKFEFYRQVMEESE